MRPKIGRCGTVSEVAGKNGLDEGAEHDLSATVRKVLVGDVEQVVSSAMRHLLGLGKSHPEDKDELESVVEC